MNLYPTEKLLLNGDIPVNAYIIQRNNECYIVDPGYEANKIRDYIAENQYKVKGILLTHAHIDHIEALDCFEVPVYLHEKEKEILLDSSLNGFDYFGKSPAYKPDSLDIRTLSNKDRLPVGYDFIEVIATPGHTQGGVSYLIGHDLYTGDTLFEGAVGRWDRPTANLDELKASLSVLMKYPDHFLIHPAHGRSSTILTEKKHNPFIIEWDIK